MNTVSVARVAENIGATFIVKWFQWLTEWFLKIRIGWRWVRTNDTVIGIPEDSPLNPSKIDNFPQPT